MKHRIEYKSPQCQERHFARRRLLHSSLQKAKFFANGTQKKFFGGAAVNSATAQTTRITVKGTCLVLSQRAELFQLSSSTFFFLHVEKDCVCIYAQL